MYPNIEDERRRGGVGSYLILVVMCWVGAAQTAEGDLEKEDAGVIALPAPRTDSGTSLEEALRSRRSVREYRDAALRLAEAGQLLWAAQGVTDPEGLRTAPSAGATYPLEVYLVAGAVEDLPVGVYRYRPEQHELQRVAEEDKRDALAEAALRQDVIAEGAAVLVITGVYERTARRYGKRAERYVHMEAGHAAENVYLQAAALGLGTVAVGAFEDRAVQRVLGLDTHEHPLYLMPVGRPK